MTEDEFDVLDELYFVLSFTELVDASGFEKQKLVPVLDSLYKKGWLKVYRDMDQEEAPDKTDIFKKHDSYLYLASKKGLLAHNSA